MVSSSFRGISFRGIATALCVLTVLLACSATGARAELPSAVSWGGSWAIPQFQPKAVDFLSDEDVLIAEATGSRIIRMNAAREVKDSWTFEQSGQYSSLVDIAVDPDDNIYVALVNPERILKFTDEGALIDQWDPDPPSGGRIQGLAFESGSLMALFERQVQRFEPDGDLVSSWGGFVSQHTRGDPTIEGDGSGHVYVTGAEVTGMTGTRSVYKFGLSGTLLSRWNFPAEVYTTSIKGQLFVSGVESFSGIAAIPDGGLFAAPGGVQGSISELSPAGTEIRQLGDPTYQGGQLELGPDGHIWQVSSGYRLINEFAADGQLVKRYTKADVPKYTDDLGEGLFAQIADIEVDGQGRVLVYDGANARGQRFSSEGDFQMMWDGPDNPWSMPFYELLVRPEGGTQVLDWLMRKLHTYTDDGVETSKTHLDVPELHIHDAVPAGDGDTFVLSSEPATVRKFDPTGAIVSSWPAPDAPAKSYFGENWKLARNPTGNLLIGAGNGFIEYTTEGSFVRKWQVDGLRSVTDFAIGDDGMIYVAATSSQDGGVVIRYSTDGTELGSDEVTAYGPIALGTGRRIYMSGDNRIHGFDLPAQPSLPPYQRPPPPFLPRMNITGVTFTKDRRSAVIRVRVNGPGRIFLAGDRRVRCRSIRAARKGQFYLPVLLTSRFRKAVHRRSAVPLRLNLRLRFSGENPAYLDASVSRKLVLKRKLTRPPR